MALDKGQKILFDILLKIFKDDIGVIHPDKYDIEDEDLKKIIGFIKERGLVNGIIDIREGGVPNKIITIGINNCELTDAGGRVLDKLDELND